MEIAEDDAGITLTSVLRDRPAWDAGLTGGDRLLAVAGTRVGRGDLPKALRAHAPGDEVEVAVFRGPRLVVERVRLGEPRPERKLVAVDDPTDEQARAFASWCGHDLGGLDP